MVEDFLETPFQWWGRPAKFFFAGLSELQLYIDHLSLNFEVNDRLGGVLNSLCVSATLSNSQTRYYDRAYRPYIKLAIKEYPYFWACNHPKQTHMGTSLP